jgi:ATP dependent DNA ligase domain
MVSQGVGRQPRPVARQRSDLAPPGGSCAGTIMPWPPRRNLLKRRRRLASSNPWNAYPCRPSRKVRIGATRSNSTASFRLEAVKKKGETTLFSRHGNVLNRKFPYIAAALEGLPDDTILDGEVVALDEQGRSDFNLLQNFRSAESKIHYYLFDILALQGRDVSMLPLAERRKILDKALKRNDHISTSPAEVGSSAKILTFVKQHGLEGVVAKRLDSLYEAGKRSGAWCKYRINLGQEFVVGGYTPGGHGFDAPNPGILSRQGFVLCLAGARGLRSRDPP